MKTTDDKAALAPTDAADAVEAHDEQLGVWADELIADLVLNSLMDLVDHDYDTKVGARRAIIAALKQANQAKVPHPAPEPRDVRAAALREAAQALRDWQDSLIASRMQETAITVGMAADVALALIAKEAAR